MMDSRFLQFFIECLICVLLMRVTRDPRAILGHISAFMVLGVSKSGFYSGTRGLTIGLCWQLALAFLLIRYVKLRPKKGGRFPEESPESGHSLPIEPPSERDV